MHTISSEAFAINVETGETVLEAGLRQGVALAFSCRGGSCHTCVLRAVKGDIPARAQRGLPLHLVERGYFLPCVCEPTSDMVVTAPAPEDFVTECLVESVHVDPHGASLQLEPMRQLEVKKGARLQLSSDRTNWHSLAVAETVPQEDYYLGVRLPADAPLWREPRLDGADALVGQSVWVRPEPEAENVRALDQVKLRPATDPALWAELGDGRIVRAVLDDFYSHVYADERLAPFFRNVTRDHVAGKQYSFLCKLMTGQEVYFGDEPRNAHHWMVIPDDLFDHRQALMVAALGRQGLTPNQIERWTRFELFYRRDIVKSAPIPKVLWGQALPLEGFGTETLAVGAVCDHCGTEIAPGTTVQYHLRLGTVSCPKCAGISRTAAAAVAN